MEGTQTVTTLFSNLFEIFHIKDEIRGEKCMLQQKEVKYGELTQSSLKEKFAIRQQAY